MNKNETSKNPAKQPILIKQVGHIQTFRYPETGEEFSTTVTTNDEIPPTPLWERGEKGGISDDALKVFLLVKWHPHPPSMKEIAALRQLCPELRDIKASEFIQMVKHTPSWKLGVFYRWKAIELIEAGAKYGLNLSYEELGKGPHPPSRPEKG